MLITHDLRDQEYLAKIVPKDVANFYDPRYQGRYKVHIPDLMPHLPANVGIWVKNQVHKWRMTPSDVGEYGQYYPLQAGTFVMIKFFENDMNTGYIDRIISDYDIGMDWESQDNTTTKPAVTDRDEEYVIFKTPKYWDIMYITEDTANEPNTIYLIYNRDGKPERRTVLRINEDGINWWTRDNQRVRVLLDDNKQVDGNQTEWVKGYRTKHVYKRDDLRVWDKQYLHVDKDRHKKIFKNEHTRIFEEKHHVVDVNDYEWVGKDKSKYVCQNDITTVDNTNSTDALFRLIEHAGIEIGMRSDVKIDQRAGVIISLDAPIINLNCGTALPSPPLIYVDPTDPDCVKPETHVRDLGCGMVGGETCEYNEPDIKRCDRWLVRPPMGMRPTSLGETHSYIPPGQNPRSG